MIKGKPRVCPAHGGYCLCGPLDRCPQDTRAAAEVGQSGYVEYDGFAGTVQGHYVTREGKRGLVLQQHGTKVVREDRVVLRDGLSEKE